MATEQRGTFTYKPALDGLRAVAVGSVMAYHFGGFSDGSLPGGFLGVDTFFVLSGYLITSLLITEFATKRTITLSAFWARRARRLLPALFVALTAVAIWAAIVMPSDQLGAFRGDALWTLFYGANWHFIASGQSYFGLFTEASPLRHAWSLAIEEQFYLFWPLITLACLRMGRGRPRFLAAFCVLGIAGSTYLLANLYDPVDPSRAYFGTDSRASQLFVGASLAILLAHWHPGTRAARTAVQTAGWIGAAACVAAFALADDTDSWLYHGGFLVFAVATAAVIAAVVQPTRSPLTAVLSIGAVRWIGQVSYGLYLWHWPVQIAISEPHTGIDGWQLTLLRLAVTFGATTLSYYLVERPIRFGSMRPWAARAAAPVGATLVAGVIIVATAGATAGPDFLTADPGTEIRVGPVPTSSATTSTSGPAPALPSSFLVVGDSSAASLARGLTSEATRRALTLNAVTRPGCAMTTAVPVRADGNPVPWMQRCVNTTAQYQQNAIASTRPQVVLWFSSWEASDHLYDGVLLGFGTPAGDAALLADFEGSRQRLTAEGATLVMLTLPARAEHSDLGVGDRSYDAAFAHLNRLFHRFAAQHPDSVKVVDLARIVCPPGPPCPEYVGGVRLRPRDGGHFSQEGAEWVAPHLFDAVLAAFGDAAPTR